MSIGQQFRASREAKGLTTSQVALATRIKVQHIENMENDDFSHIAAVAYAKGFIKLYADFLGLDYHPLIAEYMEHHASVERISLEAKQPHRLPRPEKNKKAKEPREPKKPRERKPIEWAWLNRLRQLRISRESLTRIASGVLMVALIIVIFSGVSYMFRSCARKQAVRKAAQKIPVSTEVFANEILEEPPAPYMGVGSQEQE